MRIALTWGRLSLIAVFLSAAAICAAAPLPGQNGLPPELVIQDKPSLEQQGGTLQACVQWAQQNAPKRGIADAFKTMLSKERPPVPVNLDDLAAQPGAYNGQKISVQGLFEPLGKGQAQFRSYGTTLVKIAIPDSIVPQGFAAGSPAGLPTQIVGFVQSQAGIPVVQAIDVKPSATLAMIRLGRVQELQAGRLVTLGQTIAARSGLKPDQIEVGVWQASGKYVIRVATLVKQNGDAIRKVAGGLLGLKPEVVELVDLQTSRDTQSGIITSASTYAQAVATYFQVGGRPTPGPMYLLVPFAGTHGGLLEIDKLGDEASKKKAANRLTTLWTPLTIMRPGSQPPQAMYFTWVQQPDRHWERLSGKEAIGKPLDDLNKQSFWYRMVGWFVIAAGGSAALGMILLALVSRIIIYPLTRKQLHSAQQMQKLQPQIKKLQEQYKEDKQKFQEEFWKLCRANKVNPLGGCMPLIVQMPILIMIYRGIRQYIVPFDSASFIWIHNLAQPDIVLLLAYTASMVLFQKMTNKTNPAAAMDPQQAQQQQMMTWMMPLMFFFFFRGLPAAFILYWLGTNVVYFLQQWWFMRQTHADPVVVAEGGAGGEVALPPASGGGFSGWMSRIMSTGTRAKDEAEQGPDAQSFEEKKRAAEGKMTRKEPSDRDKGRKRKPRSGRS